MFKNRQFACNKINEMLGTNIRVVKCSSVKQKDDEKTKGGENE